MKWLSFDLRALALMRICLASVILFDLAIRLTDLEAFYADSGVVPRGMLFEHGWNPFYISIHVISGMWQVQLVLFLFSIFCAMMLLLGFRTRLFTVLSWVMMLSLHNRNGFILQGGDDLLRMVLFWAMFIPWGKRYSCDALLDTNKTEEKTICTVATIAYLLQICYIYTGSALLKGPEWAQNYSAMYYVYALDQVAYPHTKLLFYYPELLHKITFVAYYFELLVPVLFFVPFFHQWFRLAGVIAITVFHGLNALTLFIGLFPFIGMVTCLGLLPTVFMDRMEVRFTKMRDRVRGSFSGWGHLLSSLLGWKRQKALPMPLDYMRNAALVFLVVLVFDWNFSNLSFINSKLSDNFRFIGYSLRLDQNWGMFAPGVFKDDGWYILEGRNDKRTYNLWDGSEKVVYTKPASITAMFSNDRWRKYTENLIFTWQAFLRGYFCNYSKRIWNQAHLKNQVTALKIIYMGEFTLPDYKYSEPKKEILCECAD